MKKIILRKDQVSGAFWFLISLIVIQQSVRMGVGSLHSPGPGGVSFIVGLTLAILSGAVMIKVPLGAREVENETRLTVNWSSFKRLGSITGILVAYTYIFPYMGFFLSTFWLLLILFRDPQRKRWWFPALAAALTVMVGYLIFHSMLQLPFPTGPWGIK